MNKIFSFFLVFLTLINVSFGLEILDSDLNSEEYFSLLNHNVVVSNSQNFSGQIISLEDSSKVKNFDLISCSNSNFCFNFSVVSLASELGLNLDSQKFRIDVGNSTEEFFFDVDSPIFNLTNSVVDSSSKKLKLYFVYSDNYEVDKVEIFDLTSGTENSLGVVSSNSYNYDLSSEGTKTLKFKIFDSAGNNFEVSETFDVEDLFAPEIDDLFLIREDGVYTLEFEISDKNLDRYEIISGDLKLTGEVDDDDVSEKVVLPFEDGDVVFRAYDSFGNYDSKSIDLDYDFDMTFNSKYSNDNEFIFEAEAKECVLESIDSKDYGDEFDEDSDEFSIELDVKSNREYKVYFYCENSNYRQYFTRDFIYDTNNPGNTVVVAEANDDGFVLIKWDEAEDNESSVEYHLYRDGKKIYQGSKEEFEDEGVNYPNSYSYFVEVFDEAGNFVSSEKIDIVPKKVLVEMSSGLKLEDETSLEDYSFFVNLESDAKVNVRARHLGSLFYNEDFSNNENFVTIKLKPGVNEIVLYGSDSLGNKKTISSFVTYNKPIVKQDSITNDIKEDLDNKNDLVKETESSETESTLNLNSGENKINVGVESEKAVVNDEAFEDTGFSYWIWFGIILIMFLIFIYYFVLNESRLKAHINKDVKNHKVSNKHSSKISASDMQKQNSRDDMDIKRHTDAILHKSLAKVKKERIERVKAKKIEEKKRKQLEEKKKAKVMSNIEKQKLGDLYSSKKFDFGISHKHESDDYRMKKPEPVEEVIEQNNEVFKDETTKEDRVEQMESKSAKKKGFLEGILGAFRKEKIEPTEKDIEEDKFQNYISGQRSKKTWEGTNLYRQSHYDKIAADKLKKQQEIEEQKRLELKAEQEKIDAERKAAEKKAYSKAMKNKHKQENSEAISGLNDYLAERSGKRRFWFAERAVDKDIKSRRK